jgi:hypothetical protein
MPTIHPFPISASSEYLLGSAEALLAGTLALMTAIAQGCCGEHRAAMQRKVLANLAELEQHPDVSQQFQAVTAQLQQHWAALAGQGATDPRLWQRAAGGVQ